MDVVDAVYHGYRCNYAGTPEDSGAFTPRDKLQFLFVNKRCTKLTCKNGNKGENRFNRNGKAFPVSNEDED